MKLIIDDDAQTLVVTGAKESRTLALYSKETYELISEVWLKVGWNEKYPYTFTWLGRPIIQSPEDMMRAQEVLYQVQPDVIIETGIAHGGSLIFYASLCEAMGNGRVIGVDIEIRPPNREALENHRLAPRITLIEGSSIDDNTISQVKNQIGAKERVLVILDSCHTYAHVSAELAAYAGLVTVGSYIVATDGSMEFLADVPRGQPSWKVDNPARAARDFAAKHTNFVLESPAWQFNESRLEKANTYWTSAWLRKVMQAS